MGCDGVKEMEKGTKKMRRRIEKRRRGKGKEKPVRAAATTKLGGQKGKERLGD
jgi:hypothetical protein